MDLQITVIGAGATGGLYGGYLAQNGGAHVTLLDTNEAHVNAINANGLTVQRPDGDTFVAPVTATTDAHSVEPSDVAIIAVNSFDTADAAQEAAILLKPDGYAITVQNGLGNVEKLVDQLGAERVAGGITFHSSARPEPGLIHHTNNGKCAVGELANAPASSRLDLLMDALEQSGLNPERSDDIMSTIWGKFVHNCGVNALCAITRLTPGQFQEVDEVDALQRHVLEEVMALVEAKAIALEDDDPIATIQAWSKSRFHKPSMLQAAEAGKQTEVDSLNGYVVQESAKLGLDAPYNAALTALLKGMWLRAQQEG